MFVHGGGWRAGDRTTFSPGEQPVAQAATAFAKAGLVFVSIDYRLAPAHRYPAQLDDLETALRWLRRHAHRLGIDPDRIGLFGASAGGNLAALAAYRGHGRLDVGTRVRALAIWSSPIDPSTLLANGTTEIIPLAQPDELDRRLTNARIPHRLVVVPGARHAAEYDGQLLRPTIAFFAQSLR